MMMNIVYETVKRKLAMLQKNDEQKKEQFEFRFLCFVLHKKIFMKKIITET